MRILIIGAGAVGFNLALELSREGFDIALVEQDPAKSRKIKEKLDVLVVEGSGTRVADLRAAGVEEAGILVAVTNLDEVNLVACMLGHAFGVRRKIARVRNPDFTRPGALLPRQEFHVNRFINPDALTIAHILKVLETPGASDAGDFAGGDILFRGFHLTGEEGLHHKPLSRVREDYREFPFLIVAVQRGEEILIPRGSDVLEPGDTIYVLVTRDGLQRFQELFPSAGKRAQRVVIAGADRIGLEMALELERRSVRVVLVDSDPHRCATASRMLTKGLVVEGDPLDDVVCREVHLDKADFFIAAFPDDHRNLISALLAKKVGAARAAIVTRDPEIVPLLDSLDLDVVVNARLLTVAEILRFVKPGKVLSVKMIGDSDAEILEVMVGRASRAAGRSLRELKLPPGSLVGAVHRNGVSFIPQGDTVLEAGDQVVVFALPSVGGRVEKLFAGRKRPSFVDADRKPE